MSSHKKFKKMLYFLSAYFTNEYHSDTILANQTGVPDGAEICDGRIPYYLIRIMPA